MSSQTDSTISRVDLGITALSHLIMKIENIYHIRVTGNRLRTKRCLGKKKSESEGRFASNKIAAAALSQCPAACTP